MKLKAVFVFALLCFASLANAQSVQQSGSVTTNHLALWTTNGIIQDAGTAADSPLSSLGVTNNSTAGFCIASGRVTAAGRQQLCFGAPLNGAATISLQNYGTATPQNLQFVLNGTPLVFPSGGGTFAFLTGSFNSGDFICANSTSTSPLLRSCSSSTGAAWTLSGNPTGSAAVSQFFTIGSLTQKTSPAATDLVLIQDQAASGALKYTPVSAIATVGSVASINGLTGAITAAQGTGISVSTLSPTITITNTGLLSANTQTGALIFQNGIVNSSTTFSLDGSYGGLIPQNCTLAASVSGNALTVALKTAGGSDPSAIAPCILNFRSATAATGSLSTIYITAATSFVTGTSGSTFGSTNSTPFRLWVTAFNNAGTVVLGVSNQSTSTQIFPLNEGTVQSSTACNACTNASSAGVFYTTATQTSKAILNLGYLEWASGLATAGVWASGPTSIQNMGPGIKKPGDVVQVLYKTDSTATAATSVTATGLSQAITPTSAANLFMITASGNLFTGAGSIANAQLYLGSTAIGSLGQCSTNTGANPYCPVSLLAFTAPGSVSSQTFAVKVSGTGSSTWNVNTLQTSMIIQEIMG